MFIQTYTDVQGQQSQAVAHAIDQEMKMALGDRPSANGKQSTGPLLCVRQLQEYEAVRQALLASGMSDHSVWLEQGQGTVGMTVVSPTGLTLCHQVQANMVRVTLDVEDMHYHQQWLAAPMEIIGRTHVEDATRVFLEHAAQWQQDIAAAYKTDSKGVKLRNMALNNMDAYLKRYFDGTGITYYCDKRHADERMVRLLVRLNAHKTLDMPIPHDDFIGHLDVVKPHMLPFAIMARDGHFTVRNEARSHWDGATTDTTDEPAPPTHWWQRLLGSNDKADVAPPRTALQQAVDSVMADTPWRYHVTDDEQRREVHVRLCCGMSMIIDLNNATDVGARVRHDLQYIPQLVELRRKFPYRMTGGRDVEWTTASREAST